MKQIILNIWIIISAVVMYGQSPHGEEFVQSCSDCHHSEGWDINIDTFHYNHDTLGFYLNGQHKITDCKSCHKTLIFSEANGLCISCHEDMHAMTLGNDCARCHDANNWLVDEIPELHEQNGFPLIGNHRTMDCALCHKNESELRFDRIGNDCINCHLEDYNATERPNHVKGNFSKDCIECHLAENTGWRTDKVNHDFFPLTEGHDIQDCKICHTTDNYSDLNSACVSCHQEDYDKTENPDHAILSLPTDCMRCHSTQTGWKPASFEDHDALYPLNGAHALIAEDCAKCHADSYNNTPNTCVGCHEDNYNNTENPNHKVSNFSTDCTTCHTEESWTPSTFDHDGKYFPIYSGKHEGEWTSCLDCHQNSANYAEFTCIGCHENPETDDEHNGVGGYEYNDIACLACHPTGDADQVFDHNASNFPLTGAHIDVACLDCHSQGFKGTPTDCVSCHMEDYDGSINPDHKRLNLSTDCINCHTTDVDWKPARFADHDDFYVLEGAHIQIAMDCGKCHNGDYSNTANTCVGCHLENYNETKDPDHIKSMFSQECIDCHTQDSWIPSTFDHDGQYFPIYSGKHNGEWNDCIDCHTSPGDFSVFTCTSCHENPETDDEHTSVGGYIYNDAACLACHPTGDADEIFDHDGTSFPLTGAHIDVTCLDCHSQGYKGTSTNCVSCHKEDYDGSMNPNHTKLNLSTDCMTCHTTEAGWKPAQFVDHDNYYVLEGAHVLISMDCVKCHEGEYNNTPTTCVGCHRENYDNAQNPNHKQARFSTDCMECHSQEAWSPSTFDHDGQYFPIYSGEHEGEWNDCIDCHTNPNNIMEVSCTNCHTNPETDDEHKGVGGYLYNDAACLACHPTGDAEEVFDHDNTNFPLTGAHMNSVCFECHKNGGFEGLTTNCIDCHQADYDASMNPSHQKLNLSSDCMNCHTTDAGWNPASFNNHDDYYELKGSHQMISNECNQCHNGDYNNTPNECIGCHKDNYDGATNPNHILAQFSTDCIICHGETSWIPATFDHDDEYFPIYSGEHEGEWSECIDCHTDPNNYAKFTCVTCHMKMETDEDHKMVGGYIYESIDCLACHPSGEAEEGTNHDDTGFPLLGGHIGVDCKECHKDKKYKGTSTDCISCHKEDYDQSMNPNHTRLNLSIDCLTCHTMNADWKPATFDQHNDYYEFTGAHIIISNECVKCHHGDYNNTPKDCKTCHRVDYDDSSNPNHVNLGLSMNCEECHTTMTDWKPATFDIHDNYYPLTGEHMVISNECEKCHHGDYINTPNECVACHQKDYDQSKNPNHANLNIPTECENCHTTMADWKPATFDIHDNYYPLTGAHKDIADDCASCHNGDYINTPNECVACHQVDYDGTTNPNHIAASIPTTCEDCHTTNPGWKPATFDIHDNYYPLTGAHEAIANDCDQCHNGDYINTPNECVGCHQSNYDGSTNPNHINLNLSTTCEECHTTEPDWKPATFDIHDNYWPLNGAHMDVNDCADCHNGDYNNTPTECVGCHQQDYDQTTNPNHSSAGYPTACEDCHTEDAWAPSTFEHDGQYFPIYSGEHEGEWNLCADCHMNPNDFMQFSCIECHEHSDQAQVDDDHNGVSGYMYESNACYSCHPDGKE